MKFVIPDTTHLEMEMDALVAAIKQEAERIGGYEVSVHIGRKTQSDFCAPYFACVIERIERADGRYSKIGTASCLRDAIAEALSHIQPEPDLAAILGIPA